MNKILAKQLANLPAKPGVYQFYDRAGKLLYVGKAKSLKNRVSSYFKTNTMLSPAKQQMVKQIKNLKTTIVDNDQEALLLENNLIKQRQPPYNIIFKDDKSWLYLTINYREKFPRVELTRHYGNRGTKYFGPYTSATAIRNSFRLLKKILALRTCTNPPNRPCFDSTLGRCLGHDFNRGYKKLYQEKIKQLEEFLKGNSKYLLKKITTEMKQAAQRHLFEQAARLRDQLTLLRHLLIKQKIVSGSTASYDVIGLATQGNLTAISKIPIRRGLLLDSADLLIGHHLTLPTTEILTNFLERYYPQVTDKPQTIYLPIILKQPPLSIKTSYPQKGKKKELINLANKNAANFLHNSFASWQKQETRAADGLLQLKKILSLKVLPQRIEGYDISNIQGQNAVGALVVLTKGLPDKSQYRKFIIKKVSGPNDVAMLAEVLKRRFKHQHTWPRPDLIMLDGGKPQLNTVWRLFQNQKIKISLLALAKQQEEIFIPRRKNSLKLKNNSPALQLLQQLRDEAHRFGIAFYHQKHKREAIASAWQVLPGIGSKFKTKLKIKFGTINNLRRAKFVDLAKILGPAKANKLLNYLKIALA